MKKTTCRAQELYRNTSIETNKRASRHVALVKLLKRRVFYTKLTKTTLNDSIHVTVPPCAINGPLTQSQYTTYNMQRSKVTK